MSLDQLIDEMIEFGVPLSTVMHIAPSLLPFFNDPDGRIERALCDIAPLLASKMGFVRIH